jgi:hypothetical protein
MGKLGAFWALGRQKSRRRALFAKKEIQAIASEAA